MGLVERIVEYADASPCERKETLCNAGVLCGGASDMRGWLQAVRNDNAKGEYYLTDVVALARADGRRVSAVEAPAEELAGVNARDELARAEAVLQGWMRGTAMEAGVTMIDPSSVFLSADTRLSPDVTIEPNVFFGPGVTVASNVTIRAFSHIEGADIGPGSIIGPFARLRPGAKLEADVHVGNFVEIKASDLASGVKANHLSYIGDSSVGTGTNIGAGTITCNYDGTNKHRTIDRRGCFRGLGRGAGRPGHGRRRRDPRCGKCDHRGCGTGRSGSGARAAGAKAGTGAIDAGSGAAAQGSDAGSG